MIRFTVPLPPAALRVNSRAQHWAVRRKAASAYSRAIYGWWCDAGKPGAFKTPLERAAVTYTWHYAGARPDIDNTVCKVLQDTLCMAPANLAPTTERYFLGLIVDDGVIESATFRRQPVSRKAAECVEIVIE